MTEMRTFAQLLHWPLMPSPWTGPVSHAPVVQASPLRLHKMSACTAVDGDIISVILPQIFESTVLSGSLV